MKTFTKVLLLLIIPFFISAQNTRDNEKIDTDICCADETVIPAKSVGILGDGTVWYTPKEVNKSKAGAASHKRVFNPIAMLSARNSKVQVSIRTHEGVEVETKEAELKNGDLVLPKLRLKKGSYYVQIVDGTNTYRSGIRIK